MSYALCRDLAGLHGIERVGDTAPSSRELVPISAKLAEISRSPIERKVQGTVGQIRTESGIGAVNRET